MNVIEELFSTEVLSKNAVDEIIFKTKNINFLSLFVVLRCCSFINNVAMHILMADDDKDDFFILKEAAEKAGETLKVSYAGNWLELWRFILKTLPDVLFLDINMPVKDGIECLQLLRKERKYDNIPILIYSTSVSKADIDKAYQNGANYFIVKPNALDDITNMIKKLVSMGKEALLSVPPREEFVII